jgi:peptidoglycan hydrolase-like protein with peptidoglycan-binding domain/outer membrane protein OmpA-like peptidoglycan-associated protein
MPEQGKSAMGGRLDTWRVRGWLEDVEIEINPRGGFDPEEARRSWTELTRMLEGLGYRPEVRRILLQVHARLGDFPARGWSLEELGTLSADLHDAAMLGRLVVRPIEKPRLVSNAVDVEQVQLVPLADKAHVYKVRVIDDTGAAVGGATLGLDIEGAYEEQATNGAGEITVDSPSGRGGVLRLLQVEALQKKLEPQWRKPVSDKRPPGDVRSIPLHLPVAPMRVPADTLITLVLTRPPIWRVRMVGMLFDADKCFLLPDAIGGIRKIVDMQQSHSDAKVLIVGHEESDEVCAGPDMALARAKSVASFLTNKPDDWLPWFGKDKPLRERWGTREVQLMLSALTGPGNQPFYQGVASGVTDTKTTRGLKAFQKVAGLTVDGKSGPATRKELVTRYMALAGTSLPDGVEPVPHGCVGHSDDTMTDDGLLPDDRRVEALFFAKEIRPPPPGDSSPAGSPEYDAWHMRLVQTVDFENHGIHVQVLDHRKEPVPFAKVHLEGATTKEATTDAYGFVSFTGLAAGDHSLRAEKKGFQMGSSPQLGYPTAKTGPGVLGTRDIHRVRLVGMIFDADKCFLLPDAVPGIRKIVEMQESWPDAKLLLVGHEEGDEVCAGSDMALARAKSIGAFLTNKPDAWLTWFGKGKPLRQRWGTREVQLMLSAVSGPDGPFFNGFASGITDKKTTEAVKAFQKFAGLKVDGKSGPDTRKELVTRYMQLSGTSLPDSVKPVAHGCAGHADDTLTDDGLQPDDRRLEALFFPSGIKPAPPGGSSPAGSPEYDAWKDRFVETVDFENHGIHAQVLDKNKEPVPFAKVHLEGPTSQQATADANGFVSFTGLVAGKHALRAELNGAKGKTSKITYPTAKTDPGRLPTPKIRRVRLVGMIFDADKCFLLPQALDGVRSIVSMHQSHADDKVLIVGHEGGDEVTGGVDLALGRAKIMAAYLTSKPDEWLSWFGADKSARQRWGVREVQLMLSALKGKDGTVLYDGSAPGVMDDKTTAALKAFQKANGLTADGKAGAATRKALVTKYMALEDTSLAAGVQPVAHGCTGHQDDTLTDDGLQPDDRRLEVLFFEKAIDPAPSGDTSDASAPEYPAWRKRFVETEDFENHGIHVQLVDTNKQPVPLATVHLDGPAPQDAVADEHGFVTFWGLVAGEYTVHGKSRTGIPLPATKLTYPTAKTILGARELTSKRSAAT